MKAAFTLGVRGPDGPPVVCFVEGFKSSNRHQRFVNQKRAWKAWQTRRMRKRLNALQMELLP